MIARAAYFLFILTPLLAIAHWSGAPVAWEWVLLPWCAIIGCLLAVILWLLFTKANPFL